MNKLLYFFLIVPILVISQNKIQGIVIDSENHNPLPYASVITNTNSGTLTNTKGKFIIESSSTISAIEVSYVGYKSVKIDITNKDKFVKIKLKPSVENLNEVLITAKENPALQLIRNTIENKSKNNIEKSLATFKFNAYNKVLVTANPDSISNKIDSIYVLKEGKKTFKKLDSTNFKFKKEIDVQHLFISEKVSEFKFQKGKKKKETILASRMAGLKQPLYEILALTFQDFSFYNEFYSIAGTKYINPIATNALKHYNYKILDTTKIQNKKTYVVYFKPKPKDEKNILGIEGLLYLDTETFAITKGIAELKGVVNVKAEQDYIYKQAYKTWFPSNQNIVLKKGNNSKKMLLFGGAVKFSSNKPNDSIIKPKGKKPEDITYFISKTTNSNIEINTTVKVKNSASTLEFNEDAHKKPTEFWNTYRTDSITKRGITTYYKLDSIAEEEGIDKKINLARHILKGEYPTKYLNLNLGKIINLNNYEGLRLGFGGATNRNFSTKFRIESYAAYGTKDNKFKYSFGGAVRLNKDYNTWFGANYTNDISEAASLNFISKNTSFSPVNPRNLNISKFYNYKTIKGYLTHDIQPNLEAKLQFSTGKYKPLFDYQYVSGDKNLNEYNLTTAAIGIQYNPKNEYMNSPIGKLTIKNEYPQITFQATKSIKNMLDSDFGFTQFNLRIFHKIKRLRKATTSILLEGGIVFGDAPITHLYNTTPNYTQKNPWFNRITFAGKNSFETMGYNEFISDRFSALHIKHQLKPFKITKKFHPQVTLVTRTALGTIDNIAYHKNITFKSLKKGYFESGIELNELFKGLGFSTFYRYGPNQNLKVSDNLAVKLTYKFRLGF
ncbi:CarboxypepD_reg-like domain-containing protein [Lutibacter oricola]|uniref:CarboxypepD_reg-like domain-containing protein n=1 Tax=Lutibacter oricola TaxID=762486 RepID=A0A1H3DXK5_9FLAO|nr:DUF5686 and carboxypeptidase-like regulatory domain-containing protein [Lutibacter oricola]SDX71203.1 CarboxypepD_reg-like domain-containing protein [Lutibacter oricola]